MNGQLFGLHAALARASGPVRPLLVVAATAPVAALVLVMIAVARFPSRPTEIASELLVQSELRIGYLFGLTLVCIAPVALLYQTVRLGSSARERSFAALRVSGATPGDVRRLGALDVGLPALLGGAAGVPLFHVLRGILGGGYTEACDAGCLGISGSALRIVPVSAEATWWETLLVIIAIGALGAFIGARAVGTAVSEPLGSMRQVSRGAPRPWSLLLAVPAIPLVFFSLSTAGSSGENQLATIGAITLAVFAMLGLGSSAAYLMGRWAMSRAKSGPGLIAAARLMADPRASGRAAATVGVISLAAGFIAFLLTDVERSGNGWDPFYVAPIALVLVVLVVALLMVSVSLAVHAAETAMDRKRATAALAAHGAGAEAVVAAHRREIELTVLPLAAGGVVLGAVPANVIAGMTGWGWVITPTFVVVTVALAWVAVQGATALARPAIARACSLDNLRNG